MNNQEVREAVEDSLKYLKDFQKATVNHVFKTLYEEGNKKHLVADEVGLGKTLVARGLVARAVQALLNSKRRKKQFRVVYICSNQALAGENLRKLNIFKSNKYLESDRGRLIFQAFKPSNTNQFQLSSLTPSTSFKLTKGTGIAEERKLIWLLLSQHPDYIKYKHGLKLLLLGNVQDPKNWILELNRYRRNQENNLKQDIREAFVKEIQKTIVDFSKYDNIVIKHELKLLEDKASLKDILTGYAKILRTNTVKKKEGPNKLLGTLRLLLTNIVSSNLEADLFILDEFQRFKELIETSRPEQELSEAALIARKVFETKRAKILLLSATPFKPFTTSAEEASQDSHFGEFKTVLSFLLEGDEDHLGKVEINRQELFDILRRPEKLNGKVPPAKKKLEDTYRKIICRTERLFVSDNKNALVTKNDKKLTLCLNDISNFKHTDSIFQGLAKISNRKLGSVLEYVKSCPYPFSFLDSYIPKEELKSLLLNKTIKSSIIRENKEAWLDLDKIHRYEPINVPNSRMRLLMDEAFQSDLWKQLWLPPSLPYYSPRGAFKDANYNSKILVFSKWRMVPRAISSLVSYEVERMSIGDKRILPDKDRVYTQNPSKDKLSENNTKRYPRKPGKLLTLKLKEGKPATMSAYTLLYPSLTLSGIHSIKDNLVTDKPKGTIELKREIKKLLKSKIEEAGLKKYCSGKKISYSWYWVAPLILDRTFYREAYEEWLLSNWYLESTFLHNKGVAYDEDEVGKRVNSRSAALHMNELISVFKEPERYNLGQFPEDFLNILTQMVIASPAICSLRTVENYFPKDYCVDQLNAALDIATEFNTLFDKPESIAVVQLNHLEKARRKSSHDVYWRHVLDYCADGNMQAMLDEYAHLIYPDNKLLKDFKDRIGSTININTSSINVDSAESFLRRKQLKMRCHYAVDFGNQDIEQESGLNRLKSVLHNFNSPFRPFVLASTSIGQEGLDFHYYCRKVMHWNLPSNAIDLEQREGRVNRYKSLAIRQNLAKKYGHLIQDTDQDLWEHLFDKALELEGDSTKKFQLAPYWHIDGADIFIERIMPTLPYSKEVNQANRLFATLALYRLTFGQPRQEELIDSLYKNLNQERLDEIMRKLTINLSPAFYAK